VDEMRAALDSMEDPILHLAVHLTLVGALREGEVAGLTPEDIDFDAANGMGTNRVEARFADGTTLAIDCIAVEDEYGHTPAQRAELDWLLYNKPLEYAQMVLRGEMGHYLSLGCDHGRLED
jgi:integrase